MMSALKMTKPPLTLMRNIDPMSEENERQSRDNRNYVAALKLQSAMPTPTTPSTAAKPAQYAPLPWSVGKKVARFIYAADMTTICECNGSVDSVSRAQEETTAAFIVRSANAFGPLVDIIQTTIWTLEEYEKQHAVHFGMLNDLRAALALAEVSGSVDVKQGATFTAPNLKKGKK